MSATTNTVIATTVDAEVPTVPTVTTVPSTLITTAAILIAAKGKGYAKQVKNKMEKTKNTIVGNTTDCYTLVKELYSHSVMLLQQTLFQTENTTSGEEFSTSVGKLMDCIETLSGSIQQNIASLKKIKQKLAQNNKQYIAQSIEFAAIPVDESETTQPPAAKKPRAKKVKEPVVADATNATEAAAPAAKKPRAKKVKEPVATAEGGETVAETTPAADAAPAPAAKKPRAKKVKEPVVATEPATDATETPVAAEGGEPATNAAAAAPAPAPKKPRAKKVKEPVVATEPAATAAEAHVTASEAEVAEAVAQAVIEAVEQAVAEAAAKKNPRAKKTKKSSEPVATVASEDATTVTSESEQPQTETIYTVIHPEVTEDSTAPKKTKKTKEPKKTNKSNQTTEPPSTPIHNDADSMTPCAPVKENTTSESIIQNDFVPNHLTFDYEITSEDICRDIELIIDELEEDMISEITAIGK